MKKYIQIQKSLQIILWLWFGLITSFTSVNVVNIARLEAKFDSIKSIPKTQNNYYTISK